MRNRLTGIALAVALTMGCQGAGDEAWLMGTEEPSFDAGKADGEQPLTIFFTQSQIDVRRTLSTEQLGDLSRFRTGFLYLDGRGMSPDTHLIFNGQVHRYDGEVEDHLFVMHPRFVPSADGAANASGFLIVDFKRDSSLRVHEQSHGRFGENAGVFRGEIIATEEITLETELSDYLYDYVIPAGRFGERPPNYLRDTEIFIRPNAVLSRFAPMGGCAGDEVVDRTTADTQIVPEVTVEGFPPNSEVEVELRYVTPHYSAHTVVGHLWDYVVGVIDNDPDEDIETRRVHMPADGSNATVRFPRFEAQHPQWGRDIYEMDIEVTARQVRRSVSSGSTVHRLEVVRPDQVVMVDRFELCPRDAEGQVDEACQRLRDMHEPENVIARRNVVEWQAARQGLYDTITRPIGRCAGGDRIEGEFTSACNVYREDDDQELEYSVDAELNFELSVNGQAGGEASWSGSYGGLASAEIGGAFKAGFGLDVDLDASFSTSRVWRRRSSLDVLYDPSTTQIQWWRVVAPRVRFLELSSFDSCGVREANHEIFLTDLRDSRLVLACEEVPGWDSVCHAVEPDDASVAACDDLIIDVESPEGQMCLAEN